MSTLSRLVAYKTPSRSVRAWVVLASVIGAAGLTGCGDDESRNSLAPALSGPTPGGSNTTIFLRSNLMDEWRTSVRRIKGEVFFGSGLQWTWAATTGESNNQIVGYSYAIDDSSTWSDFSPETQWPPEDEDGSPLWFPEAGEHTFFLRTIDENENIEVLSAKFEVFGGPGDCADTYILVVLDGVPKSIQKKGVLPDDYLDIQRRLVNEWFPGPIKLYETEGRKAPPIALLSCASSVFWIHSANVAERDPSSLLGYHTESQNPIGGYLSNGGNLFLSGVQPSLAMRFFRERKQPKPKPQKYPIIFDDTRDSVDLFPHWAIEYAGIGQIVGTIGALRVGSSEHSIDGGSSGRGGGQPRITTATSAIQGPNAYPDLPADASRWPIEGGFGYFDTNVKPSIESGAVEAEPIYFRNDTAEILGVRAIGPQASSGIAPKAVFLGFHPYFVDTAAFRELIEAVLVDFDEVPN